MSGYRIVGDRWEGAFNHEWSIEAASVEDFDRALDQLDAKTYTMITIQGAGEQHLTVGGGAGKYVVYATFDNERFWNLLRPDPAEGIIMVNAGGQEGDFPASQVVTKVQARQAGHAFLTEGRLDAAQRWSEA